MPVKVTIEISDSLIEKAITFAMMQKAASSIDKLFKADPDDKAASAAKAKEDTAKIVDDIFADESESDDVPEPVPEPVKAPLSDLADVASEVVRNSAPALNDIFSGLISQMMSQAKPHSKAESEVESQRD